MQQVDDPPYLTVGTEVSAKYKGAFCEAKVRKVVRNIKCKVTYKQGLGSGTVSDDMIKNTDLIRVGAIVEAKHPDRRDYIEATITKIQDCSQYTVVFDDGDITTLRRTALCLKSGRHFNESETLDQLPLTHPEHFGNPVIGGRRGRSLEVYKKGSARARNEEESSDEEDEPEASKSSIGDKEEHIGRIVCVENESKKKGPKENWFPALVVAPTAQDTVRIRIKDEYLVRSFKDGRYYTVPKKEATEFTIEQANKQDTPAVQAALEYKHHDNLPPHWDRDVLFGQGNSSSDFYNEFDTDSSDDEPTEEKDHFVAQLYKYMDDRGTPLNKGPSIINKDVDLYRLYRAVQKLGGYNRVTSQNQWKQIAVRLGFVPTTTSIQNLVKQAYKKFLLPFEEFDRKLGCSMVAHPRANRIKGRSLVRASSVASPKPEKEAKSMASAAEESENTSESSMDASKPKTKSTSKVKTLIDRYEEKERDHKEREQKEREQKDREQKDREQKDREQKDREQIDREQKERDQKEREHKEIKEKEIKSKVGRDKDFAQASSSKSIDVPTPAPPNKKEKPNKKQPPSAAAIIPSEEKRGKKKMKETEVVVKVEPADKEKEDQPILPINVGDKLRVYYHEQKVTYEAKVIEISRQSDKILYLVHYTGWNTRYDEWVPKERIAENLSNSKTGKRSKAASKSETRSSSLADKTPGPSPIVRAAVKRVGSRGDSQPPRSTTPSSIASNSSRTKSPATPAQRRTTRAKQNKLRRISNNTDISSIQTDSDSDSDEPVVKKPAPKRKPPLTKAKMKRDSAIEMCAIDIKKEKDSNPSSEEEPLANTAAKSREAELKGFGSIKKLPPSHDTNMANTSTTIIEKKFDYIPKSDSSETTSTSSITYKQLKTDSAKTTVTSATSSASATAATSTTNASRAAAMRKKEPSDNSSESDSYGDEDSQFSDKTSTQEDASDKFPYNFMVSKSSASTPNKPELVDKMATLKPSGIEKIIKSTLADKSKSLPPMKAFEREPPKPKENIEKVISGRKSDSSNEQQLERVAEAREKQLTSSNEQNHSVNAAATLDDTFIKSEPIDPDIAIDNYEQKDQFVPIKIKTEDEGEIEEEDEEEEDEEEDTDQNDEMTSEVDSSQDSAQTPSSPTPDDSSPAAETNVQIKMEPMEKSNERPNVPKPIFGEKAKGLAKSIIRHGASLMSSDVNATSQASTAAGASSDIYEFKEPEPLEFESKKSSPESEKRLKRKAQLDRADRPKSPPSPINKRSKKPVKESFEKIVEIRPPPPADIPMTPESPPPEETGVLPVLEPAKIVDSVFDSLRKSPCFNLSMNSNEQIDDAALNDIIPSMSEAIPVQQLQAEVKPLFMCSFVEVDSSKIFDVKAKPKEEAANKEDLESVKKMLADDMLNEEPPKVDKPTSIADKVLKALHSQQQDQQRSVGSPDSISERELEQITEPIDSTQEEKILKSNVQPEVETASGADNLPTDALSATSTRSLTTRSAVSPTTVASTTASGKKPVLGSTPEHKIDILESISPKNNDLSETIQKLETAISKSAEHGHEMSDDSTDSTDSERRLVIEDESQSSETPTDLVLNKQDSDQSYSAKQTQKETRANVALAKVVAAPVPVKDDKISRKDNVSPEENVESGSGLSTTSAPVAALHDMTDDTNTEKSTDEPVTDDTSSIVSKGDECAGDSKKDDALAADNAHIESLSLLLCEETIPGSPAPACPKDTCDSLKKGYDMYPHSAENDPPKSLDHESSNIETKVKSKNATPGSSPHDSASQDDSSEENNKKHDQDRNISPKKRRCTRKHSDLEQNSKRRKPITPRRNSKIAGSGSDSEDNSDSNAITRAPRFLSKTYQYNFLVQLDPSMGSNQRISLLEKSMQDLRKAYYLLKGEMASTDRRKKKLKRRDRENKKVLKQIQNHPPSSTSHATSSGQSTHSA